MSPLTTHEELKARMADCGTAAYNHAGSLIDEGFRALLLVLAFLLLSAGHWLEKEERELAQASRAKRLEVQTS